ncbi:site-2 protease family protein [Myxococcus qinghaiensis]|uniref:site-2 protease family protein n=1 Tax=Myxococcus qinghaiensis TaxID=2906758 RepID=UPI0020A7BB03|nr:site-2 protease family protein [Myxococcus qinghaiensis]MCP3169695.1 hypothetical protein [Myxococcus qinghaiensis]
MERAALLFWLWMLAFSVTALWALGQAAVASSFGVRPTLVKLGYGPKLTTLSLGGIQWAVHPLIPLGSSVRFNGPPEEAPTEAPADNRLHQLPVVLHAAIILLPWALIMMVAMACLGAGEGLNQFLTGFTIPFQFSRLPGRIDRLVTLLRDGELLGAWGVVSAKVAAINMLPMPFLAGGSLLALPWRHQRSRLPVWAASLNFVTLVVMLPWAVYALYLFGAAIFR